MGFFFNQNRMASLAVMASFALLLTFPCKVLASEIWEPVGITSLVKPKTKIEKHFDRNRDGFLDLYEQALVRTHTRFHFPLAKSKIQRVYDRDQTLMLEPPEFLLYEQDIKSGKIKQVKALQKEKDRMRKKYRKQEEEAGKAWGKIL